MPEISIHHLHGEWSFCILQVCCPGSVEVVIGLYGKFVGCGLWMSIRVLRESQPYCWHTEDCIMCETMWTFA